MFNCIRNVLYLLCACVLLKLNSCFIFVLSVDFLYHQTQNSAKHKKKHQIFFLYFTRFILSNANAFVFNRSFFVQWEREYCWRLSQLIVAINNEILWREHHLIGFLLKLFDVFFSLENFVKKLLFFILYALGISIARNAINSVSRPTDSKCASLYKLLFSLVLFSMHFQLQVWSHM